MNRILIAATAAKEGGALTIFNQFCDSKKDDKRNFYVLISPFEPEVTPKNYRWVKKSTDGISSMFFSLLGCWFYAHFYRCDKIISFSNINTLLPFKFRVTYFHNLLIISSNELKYKFLRFLIKYVNQKKVKYIFQTSYVQKKFSNLFDFDINSDVCWPGVSVSNTTSKIKKTNLINRPGINLVVPITNIEYAHKNFNLIVEYAKKIHDVNFLVTSCGLPENLPINILSLSSLSKDEFINLIELSDGVLITSEYETLSLPIFEALQKNKPAFVLNRDYVQGLNIMFGEIEGLLTFTDVDSLYDQIESSKLIDKKFAKPKYSIGQWDF